MSDFRKRLLGLAAVGAAFAGMSYGQITCNTTPVATSNPTLRSESQTELVADYSTQGCSAVAATTATVYVTLSVPVTSNALAGLASGNSEAVITINGGAPVNGTVSGQTVTFTGVAVPAGAFTALIQNIRVNATTGGAPQVTESALISYVNGNVGANTATGTANVGYILPSFGPTTLTPIPGFGTSHPYVTCTGNPVANPLQDPSFTVNINELVTGAFKTQIQENGSYPKNPVAGGPGYASSADQIVVTLNNVPAAATVYVPQAITVNATTITILNSTVVKTPASLAALNNVALTPVNGVVTITYTTTAALNSAPSIFPVPVYVIFAANSAAAQGPITVSAGYAPTGTVSGPAASIPTFAASTPTPLNASVITLCQTSLLFPYVTNQLGFDTGIVIANTSTDNLGAGGQSSAIAQGGTCSLNFYGSAAPTGSVNDPQGNLATGTTHAFLLSTVATGFQGYAIAQCPFLYAHGYAFIETGLGTSSGVAQGYLAEILTPKRAAGPNPEAITF